MNSIESYQLLQSNMEYWKNDLIQQLNDRFVYRFDRIHKGVYYDYLSGSLEYMDQEQINQWSKLMTVQNQVCIKLYFSLSKQQIQVNIWLIIFENQEEEIDPITVISNKSYKGRAIILFDNQTVSTIGHF